MAYEASIIELGPLGGRPLRFTVANTAGISKGTLLKLTTPRTAAAATTMTDAFAGIAAADKEANDGSTTLAAYTQGIFDLRIEEAVAAGEWLQISGANVVCGITNAISSGSFVGKALETSSGPDTIAVAVGYY